MRTTAEWALKHIGEGCHRILEIGAGEGELALELADRGHEVLAVDSSSAAVERARARGVNAMHANWPDFDRGPFDVVLFSRSLHHMEDLASAVERAGQVLKARGRILVEDFAFHDVGSRTIEWFRDRLRELKKSAGLNPPRSAFASRILEARDAVVAWYRDADHLHTADRMRSSLERVFVMKDEPAPYLYRYLEGLVQDDHLERFLMMEVESIEKGVISPLGRRFFGEKDS